MDSLFVMRFYGPVNQMGVMSSMDRSEPLKCQLHVQL